jgi:hypothetical protein
LRLPVSLRRHGVDERPESLHKDMQRPPIALMLPAESKIVSQGSRFVTTASMRLRRSQTR